MTCPFCGSADIEDVSQWGGQIITRQVRCRSCNTYFEAVRDDFNLDPPMTRGCLGVVRAVQGRSAEHPQGGPFGARPIVTGRRARR